MQPLLARLGGAVGAIVLGIACKEPPREDRRPLPTPVQDPHWQTAPEPAPVPDGPGGATAIALPLPTTPAEPPEAPTSVMQRLRPHPIDSLGAVIDLPEPCTAVASGVGPSEAWMLQCGIARANYGLQVRLDRRRVVDLAQLRTAASEFGGSAAAETGREANGLLWLQKSALGPLQELWVAQPVGALALVAVCAAPPEYLDLAQRVCFSLAAREPPAMTP